ncbi:hypothetical protein ALC56_08498 [Trachymyrmex septentrionalis]|uniref:Uncharacterized protein n=1 Tax=Trachymyrmex septentrionalis TaxID=34720 RepID=A0A195F923_9HYME|nr:hypothetical protein ALC56_08498 [Trachymyrmex septentrionalis]
MEDKEGYRDGKTEREREGTEQKQSSSCTARRGDGALPDVRRNCTTVDGVDTAVNPISWKEIRSRPTADQYRLISDASLRDTPLHSMFTSSTRIHYIESLSA